MNLAVVLVFLGILDGGHPADAEPLSRPRLATEGRAVELHLAPAILDQLKHGKPDAEQLAAGFSVFLAGSEVPILGRRERAGSLLRFLPRYPFRAGSRLIVRLEPSSLGLDGASTTWPLEIPARPPGRPPRLTSIQPAAAELPCNLLRFYLHFSEPMSRGFAYDSIRLIDESTGRDDPHAFLRLGEELWDPSGTRLTLLLDPGRIKRGLIPHEEMGEVLRSGSAYRLVIAGKWPSAAGTLLGTEVEHRFRATDRDDRPPDPTQWSIHAPRAGSNEPLTLTFNDPLDHALAQRLITVRKVDGPTMQGGTRLPPTNTSWSLDPAAPWEPGEYTLSIDTDLEDPSGNRVGQAFDVDLLEADPKLDAGRTFVRRFTIR